MMPWQLAQAKRSKPGKSIQPILEHLPSIAVHQLGIPSLKDGRTYVMPNASLRYPQIASIRVCNTFVEFHFQSLHRGETGPEQVFNLKHFRVGLASRKHSSATAKGQSCGFTSTIDE
jgi:hypothetical protein